MPIEPEAEIDRRDQLTWTLAARLTAGMLANPARQQVSVKEAMALFDQFLNEIRTYDRISTDVDTMADHEQRRRDQSAYFHGADPRQPTPMESEQSQEMRRPPAPSASSHDFRSPRRYGGPPSPNGG